jgi:hypothetical protein
MPEVEVMAATLRLGGRRNSQVKLTPISKPRPQCEAPLAGPVRVVACAHAELRTLR